MKKKTLRERAEAWADKNFPVLAENTTNVGWVAAKFAWLAGYRAGKREKCKCPLSTTSDFRCCEVDK